MQTKANETRQIRRFGVLKIVALLAFAAARAQADSCIDATPVGMASVNAAGQNGTTGGQGGTEVTVTTFAELEAAAISGGPKIIYVSGTITQPGSAPVRIEDNNSQNGNDSGHKTIIGLGNNAVYQGEIRIRKGAQNVIIRNIKFDGRGSTADGVSIDADSGYVHHVWVDHCDFTGYTDGATDCTHGADYITYSWNHYYKNARTSLLGHSDSNGSEDSGHLLVTYHHNWFQFEAQRQPRVRFSALCHVYNNYYQSTTNSTDNPYNPTIYSLVSVSTAHTLVENNYFKDSPVPFKSASGHDSSPAGFLVARGNVFDNCGATREENGTVPEATTYYSYTMDPAANIPAIVQSCAGVGVISTAADSAAPTPNPMTFATDPAGTGPATITMTATTATDTSGVDYFFTNTSTSGHDSGWQSSATYTDTGLNPSTSYSYTVKARDRSINFNETAASAPKTATTLAADSTAPTPNPMTFSTAPHSTGLTSIAMTATTAADPSGVEYFFHNSTTSGHDSGWQAAATFTDTGLNPATAYAYTVKARDTSSNHNETASSAAASATTDSPPSITPPVAWWKMDSAAGTTVFAEGNAALNGTLTNTTDAAWIPGRHDRALHFDGTDDFVSIPHNAAIDFTTGPFTVTMWIRHAVDTTSAPEQAVLVKGTIGGANGATGKRYVIFSKAGAFRFDIDDNATKSGITTSDSAFHTGGWVFVAAVRDTTADVLRLYADAVEKVSGADATGSIAQSEGMLIGRYSSLDAAPLYYGGDVDNVKIYNYALTPEQITTVMGADGGPSANAAHNWAMYE